MSWTVPIRVAGVVVLALLGSHAIAAAPARTVSLAELAASTAHDVSIATVRHEGRQAVEIRPAKPGPGADPFAAIPGSEFQDGEITAEIAAEVIPGADPSVRAFAGIGFRAEGDKYEAFYLRMLNGRAVDQLQRNHAAQYISHPDFTWQRLRKDTPGLYESYVDLEPRRWTPVRIVVCRGEAALYVHGAQQPTLIVRDLKRGAAAKGAVILWVGPGTAAKFTDVKIKPSADCASPIAAARPTAVLEGSRENAGL